MTAETPPPPFAIPADRPTDPLPPSSGPARITIEDLADHTEERMAQHEAHLATILVDFQKQFSDVVNRFSEVIETGILSLREAVKVAANETAEVHQEQVQIRKRLAALERRVSDLDGKDTAA